MAACFCLVMLGAGLVLNSGFFARKGAMKAENGSANPTSTIVPASSEAGKGTLTVLAYNGALYNVSNELNVLNIAGIPDIMTQDDCGASLGNLIKTENGYEGVVGKNLVRLSESPRGIEISGITEAEFEGYFRNYFDLDTDYLEINKKLSKDKVMRDIIPFSSGIRGMAG